MDFRIRERESDEDVEWIAKWPFPARSQFIKSRAYDILFREMERYVLGEVPGRSFLISGHRGSGKTSLVRQAADRLNRNILNDALKRANRQRSGSAQEPVTSTQPFMWPFSLFAPGSLPQPILRPDDPHEQGRTLSLQRPLLVKLHGPSLLGPERRAQATPNANAPAGKAGEDAAGKPQSQPGSATPTGNAGAGGREAEANVSADATAFALEQITIALYRALTTEFARSFTNHAYEKLAGAAQNRGSDDLELAGQFALDLDNAPRAALLRSYYARLGRIESGVLWPQQVSKELFPPGKSDQGVREMIALATAAQAFEVCSGEITDKQTRKDIRSRDETVETKVEAGLKDIANKLLGLAAGIVVGVGSASALGWTGGAAAGVATGLLSTLTLGWTSKRSRKDERVLDYLFIRRRDRATLERDLPVVIERVREAGLAPIFVVDELDKLKELDRARDPKKSIADLINSLKHLTTDYGFFCFLTDRDYYDYVARKVTKEAFPVEHSFFSHRMFILHQPQDLLEYLGKITAVDAGTGSGTPTTSPGPDLVIEETAARSSFGLLVLHRSKLNLIEILRKIAEECDAFGRVVPKSEKLRFDRGYQFQASVQLAVGLLLRRPAIRERVENESRFMQRAVDALYMLSRAWEDEEPTVRLDRAAIMNCLIERSGRVDIGDHPALGNAIPPSSDAAKTSPAAGGNKRAARKQGIAPAVIAAEAKNAEADLLQTGTSLRDLELVDEAVALLADLLSDANRLKQWFTDHLEPGTERDTLGSIFPPDNLVVCIDPQLRVYKFLFDVYGQDLQARAELQAAQAPAPPAADVDRGPGTDAGPGSKSPDGEALATRASSGAGAATPLVVPATISAQIKAALEFVGNLESALTAAATSLTELVRLQIFPPIDTAEVERASSRLQNFLRVERYYDGLLKDLPLLRSLATFVAGNGAALTELSRLVLSVAGSSSDRILWSSEAVSAVSRYIDLQSAYAVPTGGTRPWHRIVDLPFSFSDIESVPTEDPESLLKWRDQFIKWRELPAGPKFGLIQAIRAWDAAADQVYAHLDKGVPILDPLHYEYIMGAAAETAPGDVLRHDLRQMTAADWSGLCLSGFPATENRKGPLWAFIAGLRALGFHRSVLESAMGLPYFSDGYQNRGELCERLAGSASAAAVSGYVLIMPEEGVSIAQRTEFLRQNLAQKVVVPALALSQSDLEVYKEALDWLTANNAVTRLIYEEVD